MVGGWQFDLAQLSQNYSQSPTCDPEHVLLHAQRSMRGLPDPLGNNTGEMHRQKLGEHTSVEMNGEACEKPRSRSRAMIIALRNLY